MAAVGRRQAFEIVQKLFEKRISGSGLEKLLSKVQITSADNGKLTAVMKVDEEHTNVGGTLHGAMTTLLVDSLSSLTLATCQDVKNTGVSVNINMTFVKGAAIGDEIEIVSKADKTGGKLAFLSVDVINKTKGELVARGSHTKYTAINNPATEIPR